MVLRKRKSGQSAVKNVKKPVRKSSSSKSLRASGKRATRQKSLVAPLLLEIGTEELPASFIAPALKHLANLMERVLVEQRLAYESIRTIGTPRRLVVFVHGLATKQPSQRQEILGPPQSVAYDVGGVPTKAAKGFASTQGVPVDLLEVRETPKGKYVCAVKQETGRSTSEVLKEQLPLIINELSFPKSMKWNSSKLRFARPLRWIVALYGKRTIRFEVGGVVSGAQTLGHRFLGVPQSKKSHSITIQSPSIYESTMKRHGVVVDPQERRSLIQGQVSELAKSVKGKVYVENEEELLEQAVFTVECPQAILGAFDPHFLTLPKEILITAMKEHQGYFSLIGRNNTLLPKFVTVTNMKLPKMDLIRRGNERVLSARLNDAQYFYREDRKIPLAKRVDQLNSVIFHKRLGSLYEKVSRLQELVPRIAEAAEHGELKGLCERAAYLAKADLTTGLVGEFPSLQGVMGCEYAKLDGEPDEVSQALGELYLPSTPEGALPQTTVGVLLGIGDRIDTCTAFFSVGMVPSGSEDPFALRRLAYGIVRIIIEKNLKINAVHLIANAEQILKSQNVASPATKESIGKSLVEFLLERLRFFARSVHRIPDDRIDAVLASRPSESCDLADLVARMRALHQVTMQPEFASLIIGYKRASRILEKEQWRERHVRPELFEQEVEKNLHEAVEQAHPLMAKYLTQQDYSAALTKLLQLKSPIDAFFEGVMVNAQDQAVRANRLSLLWTVAQLFFAIADFSRIQASTN